MEGSERPSIESLLQFSFGNEGQPILNLDGQNPTTSLQDLYLSSLLDLTESTNWLLRDENEGTPGPFLEPRTRDFSLWNQPMPPSTALKLSLPEIGSEDVKYEEVSLNASEMLTSAKPKSLVGSKEYVRGSTAYSPFTPGGEPIVPHETVALAHAKEAETGKWIKELENENSLPKILAPGMTGGAFSTWDDNRLSEVSDDDSEVTLAQERSNSVVSSERHQNGAKSLDSKEDPKIDVTDLFKGVWLVEKDNGNNKIKSPEKGKPARNANNDASQRKALTNSVVNSPPLENISGGEEDSIADALIHGPIASTQNQKPITNPLLPGAPTITKKAKSEHDWAVRGGIRDVNQEFNALRPNLAMTHKFELDTFQKEAVLHLEKGNSVFVAAHTSAGKTVVAEYAFALARQHCTRAIYTSPIKTISNQKYRDFSSQFEVGLLTGDVSLKPESSCLIMTTEILRSMLYKGADIIRDIEWVVFDEVHYVNDAERGVVWEEVIIMLPAHVNLVLLSATVPNVMEFADWVGRTKRKIMYVTGTTKRPVPLEHSLYFDGQMYPICRQDLYLPEGHNAAKKAWKALDGPPPTTKAQAKNLRPTGRGDGGRGGNSGDRGRGRSGPGRLARGGASNAAHSRAIAQATGNSKSNQPSERSFWMGLIKQLGKVELLPAVVFCFSKKRVDILADMLPHLDFTTGREKGKIHIFFEQAISRLKGTDRELPQILRVREMLKRGIGVHHAGLLPIMKETVEMLFCQGVIKLLFCTETFAMGVNAPARTVIFQGLRKHDGREFRILLPGEYTQMAGRAGRRGLDSVGTVIIACPNDIPEETDIKGLLMGRATKLESQFRLTYAMILNLLRVEDLKVEEMLKRSFAEFHAQKAQPGTLIALEKGYSALKQIQSQEFPEAMFGTTKEEIRTYHNITQSIEAITKEIQPKIMASQAAQKALTSGRTVIISDKSSCLPKLAVICGRPSPVQRNIFLGASQEKQDSYYILSLTSSSSPLDEFQQNKIEEPSKSNSSLSPSSSPIDGKLKLKAIGKGNTQIGPGKLPRQGRTGELHYVLSQISVLDILLICKAKIKLEPEQVLDPDDSSGLEDVAKRLHDLGDAEDQEWLDEEKDLKIDQIDLKLKLRERTRLFEARSHMACQREPAFGEMWALVHSEALLEDRLRSLTHQISDANLKQMPEFHQRVDVLQSLEYVSPDNIVQMKGRVACEVNAGNELVTTEIIFAGVLSELSPQEAVAVLSALVFQEKSEMETVSTPYPKLEEAREQMIALALHAGTVQRECGLEISPEDFCKEVLKFGLMEVVYNWAMGTPFSEISGMTDVMEGSIVRCIVRLDEQCRQLMDAARVMGNTALFQQMEAASQAIKRDVIFAASLYTG